MRDVVEACNRSERSRATRVAFLSATLLHRTPRLLGATVVDFQLY
jgi:hypothetical protein